jgi:hypothetical protein
LALPVPQAVLEYNGADELYKAMLEAADEGKRQWQEGNKEAAARQRAREAEAAAAAAAAQPTMRMRFDGRVVPLQSDAVAAVAAAE